MSIQAVEVIMSHCSLSCCLDHSRGKLELDQGLCGRTDSPSERPGSSSRRLPELENVPPSLRPTESSLQRHQGTETAITTQVSSADFGTSNHSETFYSLMVNLPH